MISATYRWRIVSNEQVSGHEVNHKLAQIQKVGLQYFFVVGNREHDVSHLYRAISVMSSKKSPGTEGDTSAEKLVGKRTVAMDKIIVKTHSGSKPVGLNMFFLTLAQGKERKELHSFTWLRGQVSWSEKGAWNQTSPI
eukprot:582717-Pelagomonas_calceolata.AAC.2